MQEVKDLDILNYLDYLTFERKLSQNSLNSYKNDLKKVSLYFKKDLISLNKDDLRQFFYEMKESNRTKAHYITTLNNFYKFLEITNKINLNPMESIKMPKLEKKLPRYLTIDEINKLLDIKCKMPRDYRNKAMMELMFATGIRVSELINLELAQIDFEECLVTVLGKGKKERTIPIDDSALNYLKLYVEEYRKFLVKGPLNNYVFLNRFGNKMTRQAFFKILNEYAKDASLEKEISPHVLRHTFATTLLNNGADLRSIQELLGHENLSTTEIYSHISSEKIQKDYECHPRSKKIKGID